MRIEKLFLQNLNKGRRGTNGLEDFNRDGSRCAASRSFYFVFKGRFPKRRGRM